MKYQDLPSHMQEVYDVLPTSELKSQFLENYGKIHDEAIRGAIARIMARNQSHNIGLHVSNLVQN